MLVAFSTVDDAGEEYSVCGSHVDVMEFLNSDPPEPPIHYCMQVQSIDEYCM